MNGADKTLMCFIAAGLVAMLVLGVFIGKRQECVCPPPPEVKICRLELPDRQLNGVDAR